MFASAMRVKSCDAFDLAYDRTAEIPSLARAETIPGYAIDDDDYLVELEIVVEDPEKVVLPEEHKVYLATLVTVTAQNDKAMLCRCLAHVLNKYRDNDDLAMAAREFFFELAAKFDHNT